MIDREALSTSLTFDAATEALVRLAARIAAGTEIDVREALRETERAQTPASWVEELILQSYLFCGFPRTLNAAREWKRSAEGKGKGRDVAQGKSQGVVHGQGQGAVRGAESIEDWLADGEATCRLVYGRFYERLRRNITDLHPELDSWMIVEGYGKVLSRPGLDLGRRELCIVAACAATGQDRQLHSHLNGARNVGVPDDVIAQAIEGLQGAVDARSLDRARALWAKVRGQ
jgi:4-carboxymuconolactone decarboxylase